MADVVPALTAQVDATLEAVTQLVAEIQRNVGQLAALQKEAGEQAENSAAVSKDTALGIAAQIARLRQGSEAALAALQALRSSNPVGASTAAPAAPAAVVPDSPATGSGPAAVAPAPVPAAVADAAPGAGEKA